MNKKANRPNTGSEPTRESSQSAFDQMEPSTAETIVDGIDKLGLALRKLSWMTAGEFGLTPTQLQILRLIERSPIALGISSIAEQLALTKPTVSNAVATLVEKDILQKATPTSDRRATILLPTSKGKVVLSNDNSGLDTILHRVKSMREADQAVLSRSIIELIRELQIERKISIGRLCVSCRHFRADVYQNDRNPHHCDFVDSPFGDRHLRTDCPEYEPKPGSPSKSEKARTRAKSKS